MLKIINIKPVRTVKRRKKYKLNNTNRRKNYRELEINVLLDFLYNISRNYGKHLIQQYNDTFKIIQNGEIAFKNNKISLAKQLFIKGVANIEILIKLDTDIKRQRLLKIIIKNYNMRIRNLHNNKNK